jgi:hypothetical protein
MRVNPAWIHLVLDGLATVVFVGLAALSLLRLLRHRRLAAELAAAEGKGQSPLRPGDTVLSGDVDGGGVDGPAVIVELEQTGTERLSKGSWSHTWKEVRRQVTTRPFYVVREGGERVRVEPDARVFLVDKLDQAQNQSRTRRLRAATLVAGEPVHIVGLLVRANDPQQGGYRDGALGWVLRPPRTGRMLISTEPLADRHQKRMRVHRGLLVALILTLLGAHGALFAEYNLLRWKGEVIHAQADRVDTFRKWKSQKSGGYWQDYYTVDATWVMPDGVPVLLHDYVSPAFYERLTVEGQGADVPFVILREIPTVFTVGVVSTTSEWRLIFLFVVLLAWLLVYRLVVLDMRPWYEKPRVVESGNGRL